MSEHGRAPRGMAVKLAQWAFIRQGPTPTSAARRTHATSARAALPQERERARVQWRFFSCAHAQISWSLKAARERARALAPFFLAHMRASKLLVGGRGWLVRARPSTEGGGRETGAVGIHEAWADSNQRGAARDRRKRACCALSRERERARWRFFSCAHAQVSCSLEAAAGMSEHGRSPRGVAVKLAQWAFIGHESTPTSAARRVHAASARGAPPPERERARAVVLFLSCAHAQLSCSLEAAAGMSEHGRAPRGVAVKLAQWASIEYEPTLTSAARRAHITSARAALPPERERERERAQWRFFSCAHVQVRCSLEAAAGMAEHGRAPREMAVSLVQWASVGHEPTPTNTTRRAYAASEGAAHPPERERERERARASGALFLAHMRN